LSRARELLRSRLTRRGLALSAAFLVTSLSQGRVFAEVVPSELIKRTVRLAVTLGPRTAPPDPPTSPHRPGPDRELSALSRHPSGADRGPSKLRILGLIATLFLVFSLALMIGTGMAVLGSGGSFSDLRAVFSALLPAGIGDGAPCH